MQLLIGLLCTISFLFGEVGISKNISEKLIVSSSKVDKVAEENLLKLKIYFVENPATRILQEKHHLKIEMETLDEYKVVVIKTIDSLALRNELLILLSPLFKDIFYVKV